MKSLSSKWYNARAKQIKMELLFVELILIYETPIKLLFQQLFPHYMFPCEQKPLGHKITKGWWRGGCMEHASSLFT